MNGPLDIRLQHLAEQVHGLGPRPVLGAMKELANEHGIPDDALAATLEKFAGMNMETVGALGANVFPLRPPLLVPGAGNDGEGGDAA